MTETSQNETYQYDPSGLRVARHYYYNGTAPDEVDIFTYDVAGRRILTSTCTVLNAGSNTCTLGKNYQRQTNQQEIYFAGRLVGSGGGAAFRDRLGSVRASGDLGWPVNYLPYGEERNTPPTEDGPMKFATYYRDNTIDSQDYANQRYYASTYGRFNSPDPMRNSASLENPGSWNGYAYVLGDPINLRDPAGLCAEDTAYSVNVCDTVDDGNTDVAMGYRSTSSPQSYYTLFGRDRAYLIHAGGMLMVRESISPKCQGGMNALGVDFDELAIAAGLVDIQNGTSDDASIASAYGDAQLGAAAQVQYDNQYAGYLQAHGEQHLTVGDFFAATGNTAAWTPPGGNTVYINPSLLNTNILNVDQGLMLHEMLHEVYGLDDRAIMNTLNAYDPKAGINPDGASRQITDWMVKDCVTGKGNN